MQIFIFHRDLTADDNIGLINCINFAKKAGQKVCPVFIFDDRQIKHNSYKNIRSIKFMIESLLELSKEIPITFFHGSYKEIIEKLSKYDIWENVDFSPFAKSRQVMTSAACKKHKTKHNLCDSITLLPMGTFIKKEPYVKFTPFYTFAHKFKVPEPIHFSIGFKKECIKFPDLKSFQTTISQVEKSLPRVTKLVEGGRTNGLKILKKFRTLCSTHTQIYKKTRDIMSLDNTSHLGPYLHFGVLSPREVYWELRDVSGTAFIQQLYWREFYMYIVNYVVLDYSKKSVTMTRFNKIKWNTLGASFEKWKYGKTGYPIVDAGMRQLVQTGYMHNRARMIVAMYLIHYLGIHWQEGEKWFAQNLTDYSYANNYGGWAWCAGTETFANQFFRVFSIEQQNRRFDPDCSYIRKWCPEYAKKSNKEIFAMYENLGDIRKKRIEYLLSL